MSTSLQVTGKLHSGTPTVQKSETFQVRTFVLELTETSNGQTYTNYAQFQLSQTKCPVLDSFQPGQTVTVHFNLRGNFWNDKVITNLDAWKIELAPSAQATQPQSQWGTSTPVAPQQWQQPTAQATATQPAAQTPSAWGAPIAQASVKTDPF